MAYLAFWSLALNTKLILGSMQTQANSQFSIINISWATLYSKSWHPTRASRSNKINIWPNANNPKSLLWPSDSHESHYIHIQITHMYWIVWDWVCVCVCVQRPLRGSSKHTEVIWSSTRTGVWLWSSLVGPERCVCVRVCMCVRFGVSAPNRLRTKYCTYIVEVRKCGRRWVRGFSNQQRMRRARRK